MRILIISLILSFSFAGVVIFESKSKTTNLATLEGTKTFSFIIYSGKHIVLPEGIYSLRVDSNERNKGNNNVSGRFFKVGKDDLVIDYGVVE